MGAKSGGEECLIQSSQRCVAPNQRNCAAAVEENAMTINPLTGVSRPPSHVLGLKLDSIPFSAYHVVIILVLGFVGFIEGYDLALTGSLLVLAKGPLHMDADAVRALASWPTFLVVIGGFAAAGMSDRISRVARRRSRLSSIRLTPSAAHWLSMRAIFVSAMRRQRS
jgi:hypothetical protein